MICFTSVKAPFGTVIVTEEEGFITGLFLTGEDFEEWQKDAPGVKPCETALLSEAKQQLASYFSGERKQFSLPLRQKGTPFQERVWNALTMIPYGNPEATAIWLKRSENRKRCAPSDKPINETGCRFLSRAIG